MTPAVLLLYGPYDGHPWQEDMLHRPDMIQASLKSRGLGLDIAMVTHAPTGRDEVPDVRIARNPVYDRAGKLQQADFRPGSITDYPCIIDHWVRNYQDEVLQPDGTYQRTAYGIGLPPERIWNHKNIQTYGNRKDLMDGIINRHGVGIATYSAADYEKFANRHGQNRRLIYKPQGGARGQGIEVFDTAADVKEALRQKKIAKNGFIQPYLNVMNPIEGVRPATPEDAELLRLYNQKADRPREIRMYVITTTDGDGNLQTEAYPVMKISEPDHLFLKHQLSIALDPSSLGPGTFIHDKSVELAQALCHEASENGKPIPHYYGVFDWLVDGDIYNPAHVRVCDGNCRMPGLAVAATAARDAFERALAQSASRVLVNKKSQKASVHM